MSNNNVYFTRLLTQCSCFLFCFHLKVPKYKHFIMAVGRLKVERVEETEL